MAAILVIGGGIMGLWQAATLAGAGHDVELVERSATPFAEAASRLGGAMVAPYCEAESAEPVVAELGARSASLWRAAYPELIENGSLVVAAPRDTAELGRFARMTSHFETLDAAALAGLEPALADRFQRALYYPSEGHLEPRAALAALLRLAESRGAKTRFGTAWDGTLPARFDHAIDCRGMAARDALPNLRGVRGEMLVIETGEIALSRPVRLLHPRFPLYVVPWPGNRFMVGATMIESEDAGPATVRSALDLLGHAYTLHPAFGEARILHFGTGLRPSFADNIPRAIVRGRLIHVNGAYRHGYLLAPVLAEGVAAYIGGERETEHVLIEDHGER
jgi:glycine oxidase